MLKTIIEGIIFAAALVIIYVYLTVIGEILKQSPV